MSEQVWLKGGQVVAPGTHGADTVDMPRLDAAGRYEAITDFAISKLGDDASNEDYDDEMMHARILYHDDFGSGRSWYQIVDRNGHGDGTGEWTEVQP